MSVNRRFFALSQDNNIFTFEIDTRNIVEGATDGSENPLSFMIPIRSSLSTNRFIIRVSDGRPDKQINPSSTINDYKLQFTTPGIYKISLIGYGYQINFANGAGAGGLNNIYAYDKLKLISILHWGQDIYSARCFWSCSNLIIKATNTLHLPVNSEWFFQSIKGFESDLSLIDTSRVENGAAILALINLPLNSLLNPFWKNLISFTAIYSSSKLSNNITKIEVISDSITEINQPFTGVNLSSPVRLIFKTPNLKRIFRLKFNNNMICHFGEVDIRNVTDANGWIQLALSVELTNQTLLGWVNNFDWSGIAPVANKVTFDFVNSKYSNDPAVISAKAFLESKGIVFTRLTMA